jgi:membrane fusion protein (multidrug efflux system)
MHSQSGLTLFAALVAVSITACGTGEANVSSGDDLLAAAPVTVVTPRVADIFASYDTTGKIAADSAAPVIARATGQVVEILVEEGDEVTVGQAMARLDGDRSRLQMLQAKANLEKAARDYERQTSLRERGLVSAASLEGLKFDVDSLKATFELRQLDYEYTTIRAPISGIVAARHIKKGAHVSVNDPVFGIANTKKLVAYLKIPQTELGKFTAVHRATVSVDSMPGVSFDATIARISPTIDPLSGTFRATAYLQDTGPELVPGMFGRFSIAYEKHEAALLIPKSAVVFEDSENVIYVVVDGIALRRPVALGIESLDMFEVLGGLAEDELVIVTGQNGLHDGSRVVADNRTAGLLAG